MKNQFFYTRKELILPKGENTEVKFKEFTDSFNTDFVVRTHELEDGRRIVLLNDLHERLLKVDQLNKKGDKVGETKERNTVQSEIYLDKPDAQRFASLTQ